ncbi:peptidoglycan glycosyltransferase [Apibacter sp. B3924]|nr:peptidoglycan glycosyltransferase [Apibacter sp. B3919]MXO24614.1 peptidoglycan glycosyltransferase [Apibacter sp. B3924]MXO25858.1 peptidoglycan glycosyltransferase [Apibacter sp. B3813]MXO27809.1 peptidoglycan glycosyltransferase [Apibacter sp. B3913]MXO29831.1 peptidoglycan glycosyltransferase [Apibacter sp. B3912]MXP01265.1 peptidoglycan glycosyltransferase [Apibacter sp. B3918]QYN51878.1 peptidoglycan glycosyltransferase [Apibacter sp. ESL0404]
MSYLQLFTEKYKLNAANTSIKAEYQIPLRGYIMDRNGKILVGNTPSYELTFTQSQMEKNFDTLGFCKLVNISKADFIKKIKSIKSNKKIYNNLVPMTFMKGLTSEDLARIQEKLFKYNAFSIVRTPERNYLVHSAGNILGYINEVNEKYIKSDSSYYMPGNLAGMTGVEKSYEKYLRGIKGIKYIQKDRRLRSIGSYKDGEYDQQMHSGKDITLSIDYDLQNLAEKLLVNKRGGIVALDPNNGEILVMASAPVIDPSVFVGRDKNKHIYALQMDSMNKPMFDRAAQAAYPPGSTFKLINGLAALQMGVIDEKTTFICKHGFHYGNRKIGCHCGYFYTPIAMDKAIQKSCNNFFAEAYVRILNKYPGNIEKSIDEWSDIVKSFAVGEFMHNDLAVGSKGNIPDANYYNRRYGKDKWNIYTIISNSIGQGEVLATPLQIANYTAVIANRGFFYTPHIVKAIDGKPITDPQFTVPKQVKVEKKYFDIVNKGMSMVVLSGTGHRIFTNTFSQEGKTGTSQNPHGKDHSIFVLIAPVDKPKIAIAVVVENGGFGATYAGPMASLLAEKYLTGTIERKSMEESIIKSDFSNEYLRQWNDYLKRTGKYVPNNLPQALKDSINKINSNKKLSLKEKQRLIQNIINQGEAAKKLDNFIGD